MAARVTFALLAFCLLQFAMCAPPPQTTVNPLDEFQKSASAFIDNLNSHINALISVKDNEELKKVYQENADAVVKKVAEISENVKQQYKGVDEQVKDSLQKASTNIDEAVNNLKRKNPEIHRKANEIGSTIKQNVQTAIQETQKVAQALIKNTEGLDDAVANNLKKLFSEAVAELEKTSTRLHEIAQKP